ncbi:MAG TPA: J domain-containing protein [Rhizomicrobium sp.]|jgi:DnaJ-domain-containing protein 1
MSTADYRPRLGKDIRIKPDAPIRARSTRRCDKAGCTGDGEFRVPKSRERLNDHQWLCKEHTREFNEHWDFFSGMSQTEIETFCIDAMTGHRPTWPLGRRAATGHAGRDHRSFRDPHSMFNNPSSEDAESHAEKRPSQRPLTALQIKALDVLNLDPGASLQDIKARYKELVKRFHPDANGGDRGTEERLKRVIQAYGVLRASGLT